MVWKPKDSKRSSFQVKYAGDEHEDAQTKRWRRLTKAFHTHRKQYLVKHNRHNRRASLANMLDKLDGGHDLKIGVVTWNLGNADPMLSSDESLKSLLLPDSGRVDLLCLCVQECRWNSSRSSDSSSSTKKHEESVSEIADVDSDDEDGAMQNAAPRLQSMHNERQNKLFRLFKAKHTMDANRRRLNACYSYATFVTKGVINHAGIRTHDHVFDETIRSFCEAHGYVEVCSESLMQLRTLVFATEELHEQIQSIEVATEATGLMRVFGNKGGIIVRVEILDRSFAFLNAHLAAHAGNVIQRVTDMNEIMRGGRVGRRYLDLQADTDYAFVIGDLNFRLTPGSSETNDDGVDARGTELLSVNLDVAARWRPSLQSNRTSKKRVEETPETAAKIMDMVRAGDYEGLMAIDELNNVRKMGFLEEFSDVLQSFPHPPSYKMERGRPWEDLPYVTKRNPSFCDRVLFWSQPALKGTIQAREAELLNHSTSDHRPVRAVFSVKPKPRVFRSLSGACILLRLSDLRAKGGALSKLMIDTVPFDLHPACYVVADKMLPATGSTPATTTFGNVDVVLPVDRTDVQECQLLVTGFTKNGKIVGSVVLSLGSFGGDVQVVQPGADNVTKHDSSNADGPADGPGDQHPPDPASVDLPVPSFEFTSALVQDALRTSVVIEGNVTLDVAAEGVRKQSIRSIASRFTSLRTRVSSLLRGSSKTPGTRLYNVWKQRRPQNEDGQGATENIGNIVWTAEDGDTEVFKGRGK